MFYIYSSPDLVSRQITCVRGCYPVVGATHGSTNSVGETPLKIPPPCPNPTITYLDPAQRWPPDPSAFDENGIYSL